MNKEITCRLVDGKPVVEYKEEYVPKNGDIVVSGYDHPKYGVSYWISVYDREKGEIGYYYQTMLTVLNRRLESYEILFDGYCNTQTYTREGTPEERRRFLRCWDN